VLVVALPLIIAGVYYADGEVRVLRLTRTVRELTSAGNLDQAGQALHLWLEVRPRSAEAYYYKARLALAANQPVEAVAAIDRSFQLGFDRGPLSCLRAIIQARTNQFTEAEPVLAQAYQQELEPRVDVAQELARVYLSTYRLDRAEAPIERWRRLAPDDARPYLWRNEIESRSNPDPDVLVQNYRAALERDPNLDTARLGLAEQLTKDGKLEEADREFNEYLKRKPADPAAMVGLGRNALKRGETQVAIEHFEDALKDSPHHPGALKELAQIDLNQRRYQAACERLQVLTQIEPYDPEVRYSYAQALTLKGDEAMARVERDAAARLRQENERILELRRKVLENPGDLLSRHEVAKWMLEHGQAEECLRWAREILRANSQYAPTHELLADYYQKQGDPGLANYHRMMATSSSR
jgi:predicted Zn-dependent protease